MSVRFTRRQLFPLAGAALVTQTACQKQVLGPAGNSAVAVLKAASYEIDLAALILEGVRMCGLNVRGKRLLLKPNLVEFDSTTSINTHAAVLAAAVDAFQRLGAQVRIGEGPGHRRDTLYLAGEAKYRALVPRFDDLFVDLNRDDVSAAGAFGDEKRIYLPNAALEADLIVSIPKMKAHHWAGATLSMKNFFGLVPGAVYGWPKNFLHYVGIDRSIVELNRIFRKTFAVVDGIVGMEGNGPIQGTPKRAGVMVMGQDLAAVDATCCRIMGIDPARVEYLRLASGLGHIEQSRIEQRGESPAAVRTDFALTDRFLHLRLGNPS